MIDEPSGCGGSDFEFRGDLDERSACVWARNNPCLGKSQTPIDDFAYSYTAGGIVTDLRQSTSARYPDGTTSTSYYCYDGLGRLTSAGTASASCPNSSAAYQYAYDVNGNITQKTVGGTITDYTYDNANEICYAGAAVRLACPASPAYTFDGNGSETADPNVFDSASYNPLDQMNSVTPAGGSAQSMSYTGLGQALRIANGQTGQVNDQLGLDEDTTTHSARPQPSPTKPATSSSATATPPTAPPPATPEAKPAASTNRSATQAATGTETPRAAKTSTSTVNATTTPHSAAGRRSTPKTTRSSSTDGTGTTM